MFYGTFSTNRLYHATEVGNVSHRAGGEHKHYATKQRTIGPRNKSIVPMGQCITAGYCHTNAHYAVGVNSYLNSSDLRSFEIRLEFESRFEFDSKISNRPHVPCTVTPQTTLTHCSTETSTYAPFVVEIYVHII